MSDDTPTQRLPQGLDPEGAPTPGEELVEERQKSRTLMFVLIGVGAALLVAIVVLLFILFGGKGTPTADPTSSNTPSASPTVSASPTPTATPTPTPSATTDPIPVVTVTAAPPQNPDDGNARVTSFSISPTTCSAGQQVTLHVSWKSANGNIAYFGVNTADAQSGGMGWDLPASGDDGDFPPGYSPFQTTCPDNAGDKTSFTITVVGNGSKASKTVTLKAQ